MRKFKKAYNAKIISVIILASLSFTNALLSCPFSKTCLRVPIQSREDDETRRRELSLKIKLAYDKHAKEGRYDFFNDPKMMEALGSIFGKAVPIDAVKQSKVLVLAVERGPIAYLAAQKGAIEAVGVDISGKMLELARQNLKKFEESTKIRLIEGDMFDVENLLKDEKFNVITLGNVLIFYPYEDRKYMISKTLKLLEESGYLAICYRTYDEKYYSEYNNCLMKPEDYVKLLKETGFKDAGFYIAYEKTDADWNMEDKGEIMNQTVVVWARKGASALTGPFQVHGTTTLCNVYEITEHKEMYKILGLWFRSKRKRHSSIDDWRNDITYFPDGKMVVIKSETGQILGISFYHKYLNYMFSRDEEGHTEDMANIYFLRRMEISGPLEKYEKELPGSSYRNKRLGRIIMAKIFEKTLEDPDIGDRVLFLEPKTKRSDEFFGDKEEDGLGGSIIYIRHDDSTLELFYEDKWKAHHRIFYRQTAEEVLQEAKSRIITIPEQFVIDLSPAKPPVAIQLSIIGELVNPRSDN
ncbi:MAG: class I SAM-dependent methyltransferase [Candidatus Omnitrophica bacterium]|nr:class I SAM-dependent methyltransferase [Candidatus Omnitrophota bacterium]